MALYINQKYGKDERQYIFMPFIARKEMQKNLLAIPGTRSFHQFQALKQDIVGEGGVRWP